MTGASANTTEPMSRPSITAPSRSPIARWVARIKVRTPGCRATDETTASTSRVIRRFAGKPSTSSSDGSPSTTVNVKRRVSSTRAASSSVATSWSRAEAASARYIKPVLTYGSRQASSQATSERALATAGDTVDRDDARTGHVHALTTSIDAPSPIRTSARSPGTTRPPLPCRRPRPVAGPPGPRPRRPSPSDDRPAHRHARPRALHRATTRSSPSAAACPPRARMPSATPARRSDSFTRNSLAPRNQLSPSRVRGHEGEDRHFVDHQREFPRLDPRRADARRTGPPTAHRRVRRPRRGRRATSVWTPNRSITSR